MTTRLLGIFYVFIPVGFALSLSSDFDVNILRLIPFFLLIIFLFSSMKKGIISFFPTFLSITAVTFLALIISSALYSEVPAWSLRKAFFFITFSPLIFLLVHFFITKKNTQNNIIKAVSLGGLLSGLIAMAQFSSQFFIGLKGTEELWKAITPFFLGGVFSQSVGTFNSWFVNIAGMDLFRAIGFFPDPHVFAFYTGMILPFAVGVHITTGKKRWIVIALIILTANILTFSRGGEFGLIFGAFIALLLSWKHLRVPVKHGLFALISVITICTIIPNNPITNRFLSSFDQSDTSNTSRVMIWKEAIAIWSEQPLLGTGIGAYPRAVDIEATYRTPIYAHNLLLDIIVELGIIGGILFVIMIGSMVRTFWREKSIFGGCAIISMSIFLAHGVFDTPIFSVHVFPILAFLIALAISYEYKQSKYQNSKPQ